MGHFDHVLLVRRTRPRTPSTTAVRSLRMRAILTNVVITDYH
jgi:hypothetical protein